MKMKYTGQLVTGDFEDNTMTFEIEGEMILQAGKYEISQIEVGNKVKNLGIANVSKRLSKLSKESRNKLFAIWMSKERLEGSKTLDLMFALDDEWQRVYDLNRKDGFSAARLLANEHLIALIYGC